MKIATRKQAIDEKCRDCIYDSEFPGTWVKQVEGCTSTDCSLYSFRPLTMATREVNKQERIANMTVAERAKFDEKSKQARDRFAK